MSQKAPGQTDQQLYGASGQPQLVDIQQDKIFNCYLVSSMGALADQQPDRIREAIRYQPESNRADGGVFHVSLHHPTRGQNVGSEYRWERTLRRDCHDKIPCAWNLRASFICPF
jgi:hypothetical protein